MVAFGLEYVRMLTLYMTAIFAHLRAQQAWLTPPSQNFLCKLSALCTFCMHCADIQAFQACRQTFKSPTLYLHFTCTHLHLSTLVCTNLHASALLHATTLIYTNLHISTCILHYHHNQVTIKGRMPRHTAA